MLVPPVQWVIRFEVVLSGEVVSGVRFSFSTEILTKRKPASYLNIPVHALTNNFEEHQTVGT